MFSSKESVILVVVSFLFLILIYSSIVKFDVFAKPKIFRSKTTCTLFEKSKTLGQCCYSETNQVTGVSKDYCAVCDWFQDRATWSCSKYYEEPRTGGGPSLPVPPPSAGAVQPPPSPPPPSNVLPPSASSTPSLGLSHTNGNTTDNNPVPKHHHK